MRLIRLQKGRNDFALSNITLGKLEAIRKALEVLPVRTIIEEEAYRELNYMISQIDEQFGVSHCGKVTPLR